MFLIYSSNLALPVSKVRCSSCHLLNFGGLKRALGELEVISCDNTFLIKNLLPPLPVVDLHIAEIASRAVDGLKWRLANPGASYQEVRITPELILPGKK